jgi:flagellar motility protein MotE (MotC chaperone)
MTAAVNARKRAEASPPRLLPALMVTCAVLLGLKAVAFAEGAGEGAGATQTAAPSAAPPPATPATPTPAAANACAANAFADAAGLSPSEVQVLQALGARREALDSRAAEMDTRQELLAAAERRLEERLAELKRIEARVQALTTAADDTQNQRITQLVDVYQRMRAKDAAAVFDALDQDVLVEVASRMRQANLAEVMGKMNPARARQLTLWLARERGVDVAALTAPATTPPAAPRPASPARAAPPPGQTKAP